MCNFHLRTANFQSHPWQLKCKRIRRRGKGYKGKWSSPSGWPATRKILTEINMKVDIILLPYYFFIYYPRSKYLYFRTKVINKIRQGCSINYLINRPFENQCICAYEHEHAHVHTRGEIEPRCFYLHKIKPSFSRCLRTSLQSCCDRFLRKCLMTQRSASSFGPAGGATARWLGVESKIGRNNFVGLLVSCPRM